MEAVRQTQKKYCVLALSTAVAAAAVMIVFGYNAAGKGLVLGALFSSINFILIGILLPLHIGKSRRQSSVVSLSTLAFRFCLLALPVIIAVRMETFHLVTTIIGIFMIQLVILSDHLFKTRRTIRPNPIEDDTGCKN